MTEINFRRPIFPRPDQYDDVWINDGAWAICTRQMHTDDHAPYEVHTPIVCPFQVGDIYEMNDGEMVEIETVDAEHDGTWFWAVTGKAVQL